MQELEALQYFATQNGKGLVSDDILQKACESYERKTGFNSHEIVKAILAGQQKVVDGITYEWVNTPNAQTVFSWRVYHNPFKKKKLLHQELSGDYFPTDIKHLTFVSQLGGSTGAKLMEDPNTGKKYVMKRGANPEHVEEEYLTNQLYNIFGVKTPDFELYNKGTKDATLLSLYMDNTEDVLNTGNIDLKHKEKIIDSFVVDCLLANWDVYRNDNILLNKDNDTLYRVDNGGGLRFSAQGRDKGAAFTDDVGELDSMLGQNALMTDQLTTKDVQKQIKAILKKKDDALKFIEENADAVLLETMRRRFFDLESRLKDTKVGVAIDDANRPLSDEELEGFFKESNSDIMTSDANGSIFMQKICAFRGFSHTPEVLCDKLFEKHLDDDDKCMLVHRGMTGWKGFKATELMEKFVDGDCFYGGINGAMYGIGIYSGINAKRSLANLNQDRGYQTARDYANGDQNHIVDIIIPSGAKMIDSQILDEEMRSEFFGPNGKAKHKEYMDALEEMKKLEDQVQNIGKIIEAEVKKEMGWNEDLLSLVNLAPSEVYAKPIEVPKELHDDVKAYDDFVNTERSARWDNIVDTYKTEFAKMPGAEFKKISDTLYEVKLPNKNKVYKLNKYVAERSDKRKNNLYKPYNWHLQEFEDFIVENHYKVINEAITKETSGSDKVTKIIKAHNDQQQLVNKISDEVSKIKNDGNPNINQILAKIVKHPGGEYRGFYAAIRGYDGIIEQTDNRCKMAVIINRKMLKVREVRKPTVKAGHQFTI